MSQKKPAHENPLKIAIYSLALLATTVYIIYRVAFTIPFNLRAVDIIFGLVVIFVELVETFEFFVHFWNILRFKKQSPAIPKTKKEDFPDVDVLIATLNEDEKVLAGTLEACAKMKYPDPKKVHIYLCDDDNRKEMQKLAKKYKAGYIARQKHDYAKAGNYNNAIRKTESPYIAIFDADMRPEKEFLMKTMPFFLAEEKVGFVQTPQSFKNPDYFQARFGQKLPFEQDYFYHYIQLARNNTNSTILCGTNCVLSRKALKSVGGFAVATIAEDVATGMLIESKGYRGIAINNILAHGEAVNDTAGFLKQRSRWGRGCIQTAKSYGIFSRKGLNVRQKMDYFVAISYWCFGIKRMLYMLLPLLFAYFSIIAIQGEIVVFVSIFAAQYVLKRFVIDWLEGRYKSSTWMKIYELIQAPFLAGVILKELVGFADKKFEVTKKGAAKAKRGMADFKMFATHLALFGLNIGGIVLAVYKAQFLEMEAYIIPIVWMAVNTAYLSVILLFDVRRARHYKHFKPNAREKYGPSSYLGLFWRGK